MDPLSISASVAGLTALCRSALKAANSLLRGSKERPIQLVAISEDISTLCTSLAQVQFVEHNEGHRKNDKSDLEPAVNACITVIKCRTSRTFPTKNLSVD